MKYLSIFILFFIFNLYAGSQKEKISPYKDIIAKYIPNCSKNPEQCLKEKLWELFYEKRNLTKTKALAEPLAAAGVPTALFFMAKICWIRGRLLEGVKLYELAVAKNHRGAMENLGVYYKNIDQDNDKRAIYYFKKAIELGNISAYNNLGLLFLEKNDYKNAEKFLLQAFEKKVLASAFNLGLLYIKTKEYRKAIKYVTIAKLLIELNYDFYPHDYQKVNTMFVPFCQKINKYIPKQEIEKSKRIAKKWTFDHPTDFLTSSELLRNSL